MTKINNKLIAAMSLAAVTFTSTASATEYLSDTRGKNVMNSYGECWSVSYGLPNCGKKMVKFQGYFATASAEISPQLANDLDSIAGDVANADSVVVQAYADIRGGDSYNQGLTESRAASVADYLASKGVASSKISSQGMGETTQFGADYTSNRVVVITYE